MNLKGRNDVQLQLYITEGITIKLVGSFFTFDIPILFYVAVY